MTFKYYVILMKVRKDTLVEEMMEYEKTKEEYDAILNGM